MSKIAEDYKSKGLVVLAVNAWNEEKGTIAKFAAEKGLKQRILLNGQKASLKFKVNSLPTTLWIGRDGMIKDAEIGFDSEDSLRKKTEAIISE